MTSSTLPNRLTWALLCALVAALVSCGHKENELSVLAEPGLIVQNTVAPDRKTHTLLPGDVLLAWRWQGHEEIPAQMVTNTIMWQQIEENAPTRGPLLLQIQRGDHKHEVMFDEASGEVDLRPPLPHTMQTEFEQAEAMISNGDLDGGLKQHRALLEKMRLFPKQHLWLLYHISQTEESARRREAAAETMTHLLKKLEQPADQGWLANRLGVLYLRLKQLEHAETQFLAAEQYYQKSPFRRLGETRYQHYQGHLARVRGDWEKARQHWEKVAAALEEFAPNSTFLAAVYIDLGVAAKNRNHYDLADHYYGKSADLYATVTPNSNKRANALYNRGSLARLQGRLVEAETFQRQSLQILETNRDQTPEKMFRRYTQLLFISMDRKNREDVSRASVPALKWADQVTEDGAKAQLLNGLGAFFAETGDLKEAEQHLNKVLEDLKEKGGEKRELHRALAKTNLGLVHLNAGRLDEAQGALADALGHLEEGTGFHAYNLRLQSEVARKQGAPEQGLSLLTQALQALPDDTTSGFDRASLLAEQARCLMDLNDKRAAESAWTQAAQAYEKQLDALGGNQFVQANFFMSAADSYRNLVRLHAERNDLEGAFRANERFRGPVLRRLFNGLGRGLGLTRSPLQALRDQQWLDAEAVRRQLDPGTLLLSFCVLENETYVFALDRDRGLSMTLLPKAGRRPLSRQVEDYRKALRSVKPNTLADIQKRGLRLYRILLQPLEERLHNAERVVVCPDGLLSLLPFAALVREGEPATEWADIPFLAKSLPIHTALSGTFYASDIGRRDYRPNWTQDAVIQAFARPDHPADLDLPDLPASSIEAANLAERFPSQTTIFEGRAANEAQVRKLGPDIDLIHFAGHALFDPDNPMNSALILTPDARNDGKLATWEIQELNLNAELVVMSACETALGQDMGGEGLMGLTRSFQIAGAHSVIATLWRVEDQATSLFMNHFYTALSRGDSKDAALRAAQQTLIEHPRWGHPNYWAAFQLSGDWQ